MAMKKRKFWSKGFCLCSIMFFIIALSVGFLGIREAKTTEGLNMALEGTAIYPQPVDQEVPDIYEDNVVWMQQGNDYYYKVFQGDLAASTTRQLGMSTAAEKYPAIWENKVIWMDYRSIMDDPAVQNKYAYIFRYYDMYGYDLEKDEEFPICTNSSWQGYGDVQKDRVVYADLRTGSPDIILYDMNSKREYAICLNPAWQGNPVVYDDYVIWMDQRSGNYDIYGFNLRTGTEFPICTAEDNQAYPVICGTKIVWQDKRNGHDDIYLYDLATRQEIPICTKEGKQQVPDIYGNIVIWQDDRNGNWDIYGYNLTTNEEFQITDQADDQTFPAIYGNRVIWVDSRSGHKNVFSATFPEDFVASLAQQTRSKDMITAEVSLADSSPTVGDEVTDVGLSVGPYIVDYHNSGCKDVESKGAEDDSFVALYQKNILFLFHYNATYNCCIEEIAMTIKVDNNIIYVYEEEILENGGCKCLCEYDLTTQIAGLNPGTYLIKFFNQGTGELLGETKVVIPSVCPVNQLTDLTSQYCCPVSDATVDGTAIICQPCPYSYTTADGIVQYCCPVASADVAGTSLVCRPCPYAENVDGKIILRCCPLAQADADGQALWCYPCPLAQDVEANIKQWCCPLADISVEGGKLWCRPCPMAKELASGEMFWCCPVSTTEVVDDALWCRPCPYVREVDGALIRYCCPIAEIPDDNLTTLWCRPCPYPEDPDDTEITPYCCPIASGTAPELWCKPCPLATDVDDALQYWCCPIPTAEVDEKVMWCRPCPYAVNVDNTVIHYCCPVATSTVADISLWCKPCPYAVEMDDGTVRRCCPVSPITVDGKVLLCKPYPCPVACPVASDTDPEQRCCPCKFYDDMERNTWAFYREQDTSVNSIGAKINYSYDEYHSPKRSIWACLTSKLDNASIDEKGYAKVKAEREFHLCGCENLQLRLNYLIRQKMYYRSAYRLVYVEVTALDADGNPMGRHIYHLIRNPMLEVIADSVDLNASLDKWSELNRNISRDIPIDWCKVRTLRVGLTAMWKSPLRCDDYLEVFWDDLLVWGTNCGPTNVCCPVACPIPMNTDPVCRCCPCRHYDNMERDTWQFEREPKKTIMAVINPIAKIGYSKEKYVSPERSVRAYLASWLEKILPVDNTLVFEEPLTVEAVEKVSAEEAIEYINRDFARLKASRSFYLYSCQDLQFKLNYFIRQNMTYRSAYRKVFVDVIAKDAGGTAMGKHRYLLFQNPPEELEPGMTYIGYSQDKWNVLQRNLSKDIPIEWCKVRTLQVFLTAEGKFPIGRGDYLDVFWDDFLLWGRDCEYIPWCYPCPISSTSPQSVCCPVALDNIDSQVQQLCCPLATDTENLLWCRPCPYEVEMSDGTIKRCCPLASADVAGNTLVCRPCPYAETVDGTVVLRCCPLASADAAGNALYCSPCPLAETEIQGQKLWCRPCPIAKELDNGEIFWCCPVADTAVDSSLLWCRPCPYAIEEVDENGNSLTTLYCCPVVQTDAAGVLPWCRPCPYPLDSDTELTPYCCPLAVNTGQDMWCTPCPYEKGLDDHLTRICCPIALTDAANDLMWCRPCPYEMNIDDSKLIRFCCPVAQITAADTALWCQPCPYEIEMDDGTIKRCCPVSPITIAGKILWCQPCPLAQNAPYSICCPVPLEPIPDNCFVGKIKEVSRFYVTIEDENGNVHEFTSPATESGSEYSTDSFFDVFCELDIVGYLPIYPIGEQVLVCFETDENGEYIYGENGNISYTIEKYDPQSSVVSPGQLCCPISSSDPAIYCRPCPISYVSPDQICRPCPYAQKLEDGQIRYCCPVADTGDITQWCQPCPLAEVDETGAVTLRCCPLATTTAGEEMLWCRPCPIAVGIDSQVEMWCCPIAGTTVEGQQLWCRPCPLAVDLPDNVKQWCCPLSTAQVDDDALWCRPCPYVREVDNELIRYCCPIAEIPDDAAVTLWCRPCPYPSETDAAITPYCCPLATETAPELWCKPCPIPVGMEDSLQLWCCPLAAAEVDADMLWCRPCPYARNVDDMVIRFCCPVADSTVADMTLLCRPCPYAIEMADGTVRRCCPVAPIQVDGKTLLCKPCPVSSTSPYQICKPCPYAQKLESGQIRYCCPVASTGDITQWCQPCPLAEVDETGAVNLRCCPISTITAGEEMLWCRPCPIAVGVDSQVKMWCCPIAGTTVEGQRLWCRPCPLAVDLPDNIKQWCCPLSTAQVAGDALWCRPCPYVREVDNELIRYCCPIAEIPDDTAVTLWCRPCPYPIDEDKELTPYCCPLATGTAPELWCKPCPVPEGVDDALQLWCCPLAAAEVDADMLWCRPCPYARNVDDMVIRFCCPVADSTVADITLLCKPCPYAIHMADGAVQRCCPVAPIEVDGKTLICKPCPVSNTLPYQICKPCPYAHKLEDGQIRYCCPVAETGDITQWCQPCPLAEVDETGAVNLKCCPISTTTADGEMLWCRPCPIASVDQQVQLWCCPIADSTIEGERLWCRPCPLAIDLPDNIKRWCCPISTELVADEAMWCRPCPYVVEGEDKQLTRYCCPVAQPDDATTLWCRPCPYPLETDKELTPYCCPLATDTTPELVCKPCPLALLEDDALSQWCCPIPTTQIAADVLWCRPCPYAVNVEGGLIRYCCPVAQMPESDLTLWCKPCPLADSQPTQVCCPLPTTTAAGYRLWCCPVSDTSPIIWCKPYPDEILAEAVEKDITILYPYTFEAETTCWLDADGDGYGDPNQSIQAAYCTGDYVGNDLDCNDEDGSIHPEAVEVCNGIDDDCDGVNDNGVIITCYVDADNDGYGDPNRSIEVCEIPEGYVTDNTDCNDNDPVINPAALEICNDEIDNDCDGETDETECITSNTCIFTAAVKATGQGEEHGLSGANNVSNILIGIHSTAETYESAGAPPNSTAYVTLAGNLSEDIRQVGSDYEAWTFTVKVGPYADPDLEGYYPVLSWNSNDLCPWDQTHQFRLYSVDSEGNLTLLINDMYQITQYQTTEEEAQCIPDFGCFFTYSIIWSQDVVYEMPLRKGWSMISLPVIPDDLTATEIFPGAEVIYRFDKNIGYDRVKEGEELKVGEGYWILLKEARTYTLIGEDIEEYIQTVENGWRMIGSCTSTARPSLDQGTINVIYGFDPSVGYQRVHEPYNLDPGTGYWILLSNIDGQAQLTVETSESQYRGKTCSGGDVVTMDRMKNAESENESWWLAITAIGQDLLGTNHVSSLYIGMAETSATYSYPGPLPNYTVDVKMCGNLLEDIRHMDSAKEVWEFAVEIGPYADPDLEDYYPVLHWNPADIPGTMQLILGQDEDGEVLVDDMRECSSYQIREEDGESPIWFTIIFEADSSSSNDNGNHKPNIDSYYQTLYPFWGEYSPHYLGLSPYNFGMFSQSPYQFRFADQYAPQIPFSFDYSGGHSFFALPYTFASPYANIYSNNYTNQFSFTYSGGMQDQRSFLWWPLWMDTIDRFFK